ncbi:fluoride efflux transporter CrcB [Wenzhouxiangella marina]|uniref:Fluoride-specific ion channel FluC n=1 Tax=Wenzhouxiangella marina TaxID=1579979 RepID=A0A0K0XXM0_9GAMM|nr:fluoride efflux transporter CrcB [Wenzhouxiangella marina]AKS42428.1 Putative fluoride ion transporter CrcB [Wenzhouxiangella marina]MBB6085798.1 CrcB protein [Wenzhouxiangella marina]
MKALALVAVGGALGSLLRYRIALWTLAWAEHWRFPIGTLIVNVLGALCVGLVWGLAMRLPGWSEELRLALMVGLLGGFTTFSAFGLETVLMLKRGAVWLAVLYVGASLLLGLLAVAAGLAMTTGRS